MTTLQVQKRDTTLSADAVRSEGKLPAVYYGRNEDATPIALDKTAFLRTWREAGSSSIVTLETDGGDSVDTLIHDVQLDPVSDQPIHADSYWQIEFHQNRIFRPFEALKRVIDFSEYDTQLSIISGEFRDTDLLPSYHSFKLTLDNSGIDMGYYTRGLIEAGASPAEAVDYYMVEIADMTQTAWANERGVDQSTVSKNVSQATEEFK